jgi:hypothetical protein
VTILYRLRRANQLPHPQKNPVLQQPHVHVDHREALLRRTGSISRFSTSCPGGQLIEVVRLDNQEEGFVVAYTIQIERRTSGELAQAQDDYGSDFREATEGWLHRLAEEAETRDYELSMDLLEWTESVLGTQTSAWGHSWRRWRESSFGDRLRAILAIAKKRCPPWELRSSIERFTALGAITLEIIVHFEVDHVNKQIRILQFLGLPGQE